MLLFCSLYSTHGKPAASNGSWPWVSFQLGKVYVSDHARPKLMRRLPTLQASRPPHANRRGTVTLHCCSPATARSMYGHLKRAGQGRAPCCPLPCSPPRDPRYPPAASYEDLPLLCGCTNHADARWAWDTGRHSDLSSHSGTLLGSTCCLSAAEQNHAPGMWLHTRYIKTAHKSTLISSY